MVNLVRRGLKHLAFNMRTVPGSYVPAAKPYFDLNDLTVHPRVVNQAAIRGLTDNAYLGNNVAMCRVLGRYKMFVDTRDIFISAHLLLDGFWEMWVTEVMVTLIRPGMIVADIGANLGYFTLLMSDLVGPQGKVHAFEPNPEMAGRLRNSLIVNGFHGRAELHPILLGSTDGEMMDFHINDLEPGGAHMTHPAGEDEAPGTTKLATHRLDSRPDWQRIEFIKIDVEGAEELVWRGSEQLLRQSSLKTVIMEFAPSRYPDTAGFLDTITAAGFRIEVISPGWGIRAISHKELLGDGSPGDMMLLLRR